MLVTLPLSELGSRMTTVTPVSQVEPLKSAVRVRWLDTQNRIALHFGKQAHLIKIASNMWQASSPYDGKIWQASSPFSLPSVGCSLGSRLLCLLQSLVIGIGLVFLLPFQVAFLDPGLHNFLPVFLRTIRESNPAKKN